MIRDIRILFEKEKEEDYYEPTRENFCNNNDIEYESNGHKNRNLLFDDYLKKIETYFRNIILIFKFLMDGKFS